jgi:hypothetical protein
MGRLLFPRLLAAACLLPITAAATSAAWNVPGSWDNGVGMWDASTNLMTETAPGSGVFNASLTGLTANAFFEFKVVEDGSFAVAYPPANSWAFADGNGDLTVTFDTNAAGSNWSPQTHRISVSNDVTTVHAVGNFMEAAGGAGNWNPSDPAFQMSPLGGGLYSLAATISTPGTYEFKSTKGDWGGQWGGDGRSVNSSTVFFTTTSAGQAVNFYTDTALGAVRVEVIPEPSAALLGLVTLGLGLARRRRV